MRLVPTRVLFVFLAVSLFTAAASANTIPVGFVSYDATDPTSGLAQFDITNQTGPNSSVFPDTTWPVTNSINLSSLSLTVNFVSGPPQTFGSGFFALEPDGLSFIGPDVSGAVASAVMTGTFSTTTFSLKNGSSVTVLPGFSATITDPTGTLQDQDFAIIDAKTTTVPEPGSWILLGIVLGTGVLGVAKRSMSRT